METSTIFRIIRDNFTLYSTCEYNDVFRGFMGKCGRYYHNEEQFTIIVFDEDNSDTTKFNAEHNVYVENRRYIQAE